LRIKKDELYFVHCTFHVVTMFMRATQENESGIQKQISTMKQEYMQDYRSTGV